MQKRCLLGTSLGRNSSRLFVARDAVLLRVHRRDSVSLAVVRSRRALDRLAVAVVGTGRRRLVVLRLVLRRLRRGSRLCGHTHLLLVRSLVLDLLQLHGGVLAGLDHDGSRRAVHLHGAIAGARGEKLVAGAAAELGDLEPVGDAGDAGQADADEAEEGADDAVA